MGSNARNINMAAKVLLAITVILKFKKLITEVMHIRVNAMLGYDLSNISFEIAFCVHVIVFGILTIMRRRYALITLYSLYVAKLLILLPINSNMSISYYMGQQFANFMFDLGLFSIAMFFKSNGISGWRSMLMSNKRLENTAVKPDSEEVFTTDIIPTIEEEEIPTQEKENHEATEHIEQVNIHTPEKTKHHCSCTNKSIKYLISAFAGITCLCFVALIYLSQKSYPSYIESFGDKWKYTFKLPNNDLAHKLYTKALSEIHGGDYLCPMDDDFIWGNKNVFSFEGKTYVNKDIYAIQDTVRCVEDIIIDSNYAYFTEPNTWTYFLSNGVDFHSGHWDAAKWERNKVQFMKDYPEFSVTGFNFDIKWSFLNGDTLVESYDELKSSYPNILIVRINEYNYSKSLESQEQIMNEVSRILVDDLSILNNVAGFYIVKGNLNAAADVYLNSVNVNSNSSIFHSKLSGLLYEVGEIAKAQFHAENALEINSNEVEALEILSKIAAENKNWVEAKRLSRKAIDYGSKSADPYFVYSAASGELGDDAISEEYYNKGYRINPDCSLAKKYEQYAGDPFTIIYQEHAFTDSNDRIITDYGKKLYSSKSQWITTRAKIKWHRGGAYDLQVRLYCNGYLSSGGAASSGYTYNSRIYNFDNSEEYDCIREIGGWGNSTPGNWPEGNYRIEILYKGKIMSSSTFVLY